MGKGGTRFVGEAIAHRSGRAKSSYTNKELKKNMEKFLETGVHPDLERAKQVRRVQLSCGLLLFAAAALKVQCYCSKPQLHSSISKRQAFPDDFYALHVPACVPTAATDDTITSASPVLTFSSADGVSVLLDSV
jgi:hypothetical protein